MLVKKKSKKLKCSKKLSSSKRTRRSKRLRSKKKMLFRYYTNSKRFVKLLVR